MSKVMNHKIKIKETALLVIDVTNAWAHPTCEIKKWDVTFGKIRKMVPICIIIGPLNLSCVPHITC
ncbi:MAG: hypothetical protein ABII13_03855, partial [Patescibacteria group bacterium]